MKHSWIVIDIIVTLLLLCIAGTVAFFSRSSHAYTIVSGSMSPAYPLVSIVMTREQSQYQIGDVITFSRENQMITHRVTSIDGSGSQSVYTVKGDANINPDPEPVSSQVIKGVVVLSFPYLGIFIGYIKTPFGFLSTILLPSVLFISLELWEVHQEYQRHLEKKILTRLGLL